MGKFEKLKFKLRKFKAKFKVRRLLAKNAKEDKKHENRLAQVHRVEGTEHRIERAVDVMVAARRSVYGAEMLPRTMDFGVTPEEAKALHQKQKASQSAGGIWDGNVSKDDPTGKDDANVV
ncbi:mei2-like protein [Fusarium subglutinans]|uniref:Mei2-like protein n=1 Tax=Gibberella subglutinans TaxID=42677 RepID=A0A8H5V1F1_GIBSU|nr:mei2-like protein [Fusarium subglutinans]KAF5607021.1 mei2-like protein [Fusarium subglutinans]